MAQDEYLKGLDDDQLNELIPTFSWAFNVDDLGRVRRWLQRGGVGNLRGLRQDGRLTAGLLVIPMGQWFGGRSVPSVGIAGVATAAEARGQGAGHAMMAACMGELYEQGTALSVLFAATYSLYRGVGYELAGYLNQLRVETLQLPRGDRSLPMRRIEPVDAAAVSACYAERARRSAGWLDRGEYIWPRVRAPREKPARGWAVDVDGRIEGYAWLTEVATGGDDYRIDATDLVANTERAARRLLVFLGDHRSIPGQVRWHGEPTDPLVVLIPDRRFRVVMREMWMMRVVEVKAALEARGYASVVSGKLELAIRDETLPGNAGNWILEVADGFASVHRGGCGSLGIDARGLAALYSGMSTATNLRGMGLADGSDDVLATANAFFAGPMPTVVDEF